MIKSGYNGGMKTKSGIYVLRNTIDQKVYIGSAVDLARRRAQHLSALRGNRHINPHLQRAFNKDSKNAFTWEVLEVCDITALLDREQFYLSQRHRGEIYNIRLIAHSNLGMKQSPESIEKRRKAMTGRKASPETLEKMRGRKASPETLEKMRIASTGRPKSEAERAKLSASLTGVPKSAEHIEKVAAKRRGSKHSAETIRRYRETRKGRLFLTPESIEARSKSYPALVAPDGTIHPAGFRRAEFCRQHSLLESGFNKMCRGETKTHRGWQLRY